MSREELMELVENVKKGIPKIKKLRLVCCPK